MPGYGLSSPDTDDDHVIIRRNFNSDPNPTPTPPLDLHSESQYSYQNADDADKSGAVEHYSPLQKNTRGIGLGTGPGCSGCVSRYLDTCWCGCCTCCRAPCFGSGKYEWLSCRLFLSATALFILLGLIGAVELGLANLVLGGAERDVDTFLVTPPAPSALVGSQFGYDFLEVTWAEHTPKPPPSSGASGDGISVAIGGAKGGTEVRVSGDAESFTAWISGPCAHSKQSEVVFERSLETERRGEHKWGVVIDDLAPGTTYCMQVCGENDAGKGDCSDTYCFKTLEPKLPEKPGQPWFTRVGPSSLEIQFQAAEPRGYPITSYEIQCRRVRGPKGGGRAFFRTAGILHHGGGERGRASSTSDSVKGGGITTSHKGPFSEDELLTYKLKSCAMNSHTPLNPGEYYEIRVRASCAQGNGEFGTSLIGHTDMPGAGAPLSPRGSCGVTEVTPTSVTVHWQRSPDNGSEILRYHLKYRSANTGKGNSVEIPVGELLQTGSAYLSSSANLAYVLSGLQPAQTYEISFKAENIYGVSSDSSATRVTMAKAVNPSRIKSLNVKVKNGTCASLAFSEPIAGGMEIEEYQVETDDWFWYRESFAVRDAVVLRERVEAASSAPKKTATSVPSAVEVLLHDLIPAGKYKARVRARNAAGWGDWSEVLSFETPELGKCATKENIHAYQEFPDIKDRLGDCMIGCHPLRVASSSSCAESCIMRTLGLTEDCAKCYSESSYCIIRRCALQCINPKSQMCTNCNKVKCVPLLRECTGVPEWGLKIPY